jgi:hypothetical protein
MRALKTYLASKGKSLKQFCEENKFNYDSFRVMMTRKYNLSNQMALKISQATKGKVSVLDLLYPGNGGRKSK